GSARRIVVGAVENDSVACTDVVEVGAHDDVAARLPASIDVANNVHTLSGSAAGRKRELVLIRVAEGDDPRSLETFDDELARLIPARRAGSADLHRVARKNLEIVEKL